jgi:hypothetical protein
MQCEMCTENDIMTRRKLGKAVAVQVAEVQPVQQHGQACTKGRTGAVALRAAVELAVQLGRGDEVNRQATMAKPTICRWTALYSESPRSVGPRQ